MPRGDGKGPMGTGAMTGRAGGYCNGSSTPGTANPLVGSSSNTGSGRYCQAWGQGQGLGGGRRAGRRNIFQATGMPGRMNFASVTTEEQINPEIAKNILKNKAKALEAEMVLIKNQLDALETGTTPE